MSKFLLGFEFHIVNEEVTNKRFLPRQHLHRPPVWVDLPPHLELPLDRAYYKSEMIALAWKMHNWLKREWELGRLLHIERTDFFPLEPFASMLGNNWPDTYKIAGWHQLILDQRENLKVYEENGVWTLETEKSYAERHAPPPPPPVFHYAESQEAELDLIGRKLERLFSNENPNRVSTVRRVLSPSGEDFVKQMARDFCQHMYVENRASSPAKYLSPELLLPILQQILPSLITEELATKANAPLKPLEELGAHAKAERERLEQAAGRVAPGPT